MLPRFTAIIIDDERLARKELRSMLADHGAIDVIGEASSVAQAIEVIQSQEPDVVFLDIQLPGETGFDLLERIQLTARVIFVTAFDAYAIKAFEVNALDYLLKPINPDRLSQAIDRLSLKEETRTSSTRSLDYEDRVFIEVDERSQLLKVSDIVAISAQGDYSEIVSTEGSKMMILKPLKHWEDRLPVKHFTRIHRSTLINVDYVDKVENWFNRSYRIHLKFLKEPVLMSRRYAARFKTNFG
jgi:two-component system, LytTR family, response regulator